MPYSPLQPRGKDGKWISKGGNALIHTAVKASGAGRKVKKTKPKPKRGERGTGIKGLKANFTPYVRVNKRSQTVGYNAGTLIPGTHRRVVTGSYVRLESTRNKTAADRFVEKHAKKALPSGTKRGKAARYLHKNVAVTNPAIRATAKGHQVRLGTSRGAGPTVIVRRGKHKTPQAKSYAGIKKYDARMRQLATKKAAKKKPRPQRRRAAARKRKKK